MRKRQPIYSFLIFLLTMTALFGIFSEPTDDSATWMRDLIISKAIGVSAGLAAYALSRLTRFNTFKNKRGVRFREAHGF